MISVFFKKQDLTTLILKAQILIVIFLLFGKLKKSQKKDMCEKEKTTDPLITPFTESKEIHPWKTAASLALSV